MPYFLLFTSNCKVSLNKNLEKIGESAAVKLKQKVNTDY